ncbi:LysR family transcriptional regulator [Kitasatospora sp. NBC_01266]|uniref:LysR family transcriptional regulator n=1 Tax=Kitasatospora sp. NBC_01266 TaxID=2903572 RepID=UPI002E32E8BA|nr:LysR family transcriptional regulator [Kitasatospora sp. NBC_01266]
MSIDELRWFLAVAETEHVTDAAALVGTSQPTLSRAIARLERRLGTPLFDRDRHRLRLNDCGRVYRRHARRALAELDTAQDRIAALLDPAEQTLRLAFAHSLGGWLVPELLGAYQRQSPGAAFSLHQESAAGVLELLQDGSAELAVTGPRPDGAGWEWLPLREERLALAVPTGHPLAERPVVRLAELAGERFIIMREAPGLRQLTCRLFHQAGVTASVVLEAGEVATIRGMVGAGLGLAVLPVGDGLVGHLGVRLVPLAEQDACRGLGLAWRADRPASSAARRFRAFAARWAAGRGATAAADG